MTSIDVLADTDLRSNAVNAVDQFLAEHDRCPVRPSQIHGLRQLSTQQPGLVKRFADHQRQRVEKKLETASRNSAPKLETEQDFWKLVADLCESDSHRLSIAALAESLMPEELHKGNIPEKQQGMSHEDRSHRKQLMDQRRDWRARATAELTPVFFQHFCIHYLVHFRRTESA